MISIVKRERKKIFYCAYFLYLIATVLQSTTFTQYSVLAKIFVFMRYLSFVAAGIKVFLDWYFDLAIKRVQNPENLNTEMGKKTAVYILTMAVSGIVSVVTGDNTLLFAAVLLLAAREIPFDDIVQKSLKIQCILMGSIVVCSAFHIIPDLLFKRADIPIRHALGYTYPSVMVTGCLFIFLLYVWNKNEYLSDIEVLIIETFNVLIYILTDSRTGFLVLGAAAIILWGMGKLKGSKNAMREEKHSVEWIRKIGRNAYDYMAVYLTALLLILCALMPFKAGQLINRILTDRIRLAANAIKNYGVHLLGNRIEWIGFGGSTDTDSLLAEYNFVDSSYGYILVNYGIIILILTLLVLVVCCKYIRRTKSNIRKFVFGIVILYCFIEPRLLEIHVNNFLFIAVPAVIWYCKEVRRKFLERKRQDDNT